MSKELREIVFNECLTKDGMAELRTRYPSDVVVDMTNDNEFKKARKSRTERNKLVEAINRVRIDTANDIKEEGDALIEDINDIYGTVVAPFEAEDERRKEEDRKVKAAHEEILKAQRVNIDGFMDFVTTSEGGDSKSISSAIDAVSNIECEVFHKDIIHEAFKQKEEVMSRLSSMLTQRIAYEAAEEERKILEERQKEEEKKRRFENELNDLRMIPVNFMGKPARDISKKIDDLKEREPAVEMFGHLHAEAVEAKAVVVEQLEGLLTTTLAAEKQKAEAESVSHETTEQKINHDNVAPIKPETAGQSSEPEQTIEEVITRFFAGFAEFNPEQAEAITEVIMSDGVPGVTIEVIKES